MANKELKFTLEIKGIDLPESVKENISKALNDTLMQKLGELDLHKDKEEKDLHGGGFFAIYRPDGGRILNLMSPELVKKLDDFEKLSGIKGAIGFNVQR